MTDDDSYVRTRVTRGIGAAIADVANFEPPTLGHSPEWWEQRDREVAAARAQDAAAAESQRMIGRAGELRENGFPALFVTAALGELADTQAMRFVGTFVYLPKRLLVLAGGVGAGKTTAATWVALKGQDPRPGFLRVNELERRGRYDKKLGDWLEQRTSLVIDDVGAEYLDGKGAFRSLMDEVVDAFYADRRTLVLTTNLRPRRKSDDEQEQFLERYGARVWSRMNEAGTWADCGVRDLRRDPLKPEAR